ncbi:MAG: hypothetical protein ACLPTB_12475 [Acidimicrobiales bacterium]|jgi:hypothetical protein
MRPATPALETTLPLRSRGAGLAGLLALGAALSLGLGACGLAATTSDRGAGHVQSTSNTHAVLGVVTGTYQLEGGAMSPTGPNPPLHALDGFITATGAHGHAKVMVKDGQFRLNLRPGTYKLVGWTASIKEVEGSQVVKNGTTCGAGTVVVTKHHTTKAALYCIVP